MNKSSIFKIAALVAAGALSQAAMAADGTITFTGKITASTCTINGGKVSPVNFSVALPTVSTTALNTDTPAVNTAFDLTLTNCDEGKNVYAYFENGDAKDPKSGYVRPTAGATGAATGVSIEILNADDSSRIVIGAGNITQNSHGAVINNKGATLKYLARYVKNGETVSAGTVNASVSYNLVYQ